MQSITPSFPSPIQPSTFSDSGLFGPGSITWKVNRELLVLLGGPAAAVLQVAHPVVARGVAHHSNFQKDTFGRLMRTLDAVYTVAFGPQPEVEKVRQSVAKIHATVRGADYSAFDPSAQLWVLATLINASTTLYEQFITPLSSLEKDRLLTENQAFAQIFGLPPHYVWKTWHDFQNYWLDTLNGPLLASDPTCSKIAHAILQPAAPFFFRISSPILHTLACELIPPHLQKRLGIKPSQSKIWILIKYLLPTLILILPAPLRYAPAYRRAIHRIHQTQRNPKTS